MMKNEFMKLVEIGEYENASVLLDSMEEPKIRDYLLMAAFEMENLSILGFGIYMLNKTNSELWRSIVIMLLLHPLCHLEGAYSFAFFYAKEELRLDRSEENLTQLLFFNEIPEKLLSNTEALKIAKEVLSMNPDNTVAKDVIKRMTPCPYCLQGEVLKAKVKKTGEMIYICEDCDTVWKGKITDENGISLDLFLQQRDCEAVWNELLVIE